MNAKLTTGIAALTLALALTLAGGASGAPTRASGTLQLDVTLTTIRRNHPDHCPSGTPATIFNCVRYVGEGTIPGLGRATSTYTKIIREDDENCQVLLPNTAVIEVAGKGTLELSRPGKTCIRFSLPAEIGPLEFTVTGASGTYAGASGSLTFKSFVYAAPSDRSNDRWTGTLTVPGVDFDITPPIVTGAVSKTVRAPKKARRVRVRYTVTAQDAVDGSVPVSCAPRSGFFFELGRTKVTCSATDASGNTRQTQFTVTVRRARK